MSKNKKEKANKILNITKFVQLERIFNNWDQLTFSFATAWGLFPF